MVLRGLVFSFKAMARSCSYVNGDRVSSSRVGIAPQAGRAALPCTSRFAEVDADICSHCKSVVLHKLVAPIPSRMHINLG